MVRYINGQAETAVRDCVARRYGRDRFLLTNKLTSMHFKTRDDIRPLFEQQLESCGMDSFVFYLMHAQRQGNYQKYQMCQAYETLHSRNTDFYYNSTITGDGSLAPLSRGMRIGSICRKVAACVTSLLS